ncbi:MAG: glycoside hydrolase family 65 protein [Propionibacteriaceae bacterium]|jgi:alpha,alpha-trehalose phosphorylase|nr:glycoside hydrolase family 65 protein [Propionibacteriaceae bacterium]
MTWADPLDRGRFPADEWALVEVAADLVSGDHSQTLFNVANGYLGIRPGSGFAFLNGFHETYRIQHAENACGLARVGQVIVPVPDGTAFQVAVDGVSIADCSLTSRIRRLDFRSGELSQDEDWKLPDGRDFRIRQTWIACLARPELAVTTISVDADGARVDIAALSAPDPGSVTPGDADDPRKAEMPVGGGLERIGAGSERLSAYRCRNSRLAAVVGTRDESDGTALTRYVSYATTPFAPDDVAAGLAVTCDEDISALRETCLRALDDAPGLAVLRDEQRAWLAAFWERGDVRVELESASEQVAVQQAIRFELFQLAQATAAPGENGIPAKGLSGSGYSGHYFWDQELFILPFLSYTDPDRAREVLRFRHRMLGAAKRRASELDLAGALYPWRTINGEEASAYFPAGTAQYHICADIAYAVQQYLNATGDTSLLADGGAEILAETARMWADLGFWADDGRFHIHGVTGPDEYSALVDDNYYTNAMARHNLRCAIAARQHHDATDAELAEWARIADAIHLGYDEQLGVHAQDAQFLRREPWPTANQRRPLLLHYHPLVIYRHQVVKQADLVLALHLLGHEFTLAEKQADFAYYDPLTTGDSTLSAATQAIIAAEVGESELAERYFGQALFVDLADLHHNTADGVHLASAGGVWLALVAGFAGMRDSDGEIRFDPHLPPGWKSLSFSLTVGGERTQHVFSQQAAER